MNLQEGGFKRVPLLEWHDSYVCHELSFYTFLKQLFIHTVFSSLQKLCLYSLKKIKRKIPKQL